MDESKIYLGNFEMLKALYDFKATYSKTLSFRENDYFILHQESTKQRNWWQVINDKGEIGFVPSNYVQKVKVNPAFLLQFLDDCIQYLQTNKPSNTLDKEEIMLRLNEKRRQTEQNIKSIEVHKGDNDDSDVNAESNISVDTMKETRSTTSISTSTEPDKNLPDLRYGVAHNNSEEPIKPPPKSVPVSLRKHSVEKESSQSADKPKPIEIKAQDVYELVETVRIHTQLSHELSRVAVVTVITQLQNILPPNVSKYLSEIISHAQMPLSAGDFVIEQTHDASRLKLIFKKLTDCKEDEQQRSWMLHEDESVISNYITELISIISNADLNISKHVIAMDQYNAVFTLIQYYQMEIRWSIRQLLLQAFGVMCSIDKTNVSIMLNSVLPMELARDMRTNPRNITKLNYSCLLLTMIFSMGEQMPFTHFEQLGQEFISFVFNNIENPPETDIDEQIPDLFFNFILAFNLQFDNLDENIVLKVLAEERSAKTFTEKLLLLFNREEDPVRIFDFEPAPPNSLIKLFLEMFDRENTAELFYTNDIKVLIDIIVRQLSDLSPGDKKRGLYLELCRRVMRNTNYAEHRHRYEDIHKCFTRIFCEESEQSRQDQTLVRDISNEFPHFFKL